MINDITLVNSVQSRQADIKISSKIWGQFILLRAVIPALRNVIIGLDSIISCMRLPHQVWQ